VIKENMIEVLTDDGTVKNVEIELTFDPPWTPEMMTDSAKMEIGFL
jgi:metal-sulfur cluster biosynthetic enzyme